MDVVLNTWLDVQKKWQALESIFVGSADIRVQLPEDSKRFDVVNADFQVYCATLARHLQHDVHALNYPFAHDALSVFAACKAYSGIILLLIVFEPHIMYTLVVFAILVNCVCDYLKLSIFTVDLFRTV